MDGRTKMAGKKVKKILEQQKREVFEKQDCQSYEKIWRIKKRLIIHSDTFLSQDMRRKYVSRKDLICGK